MQGDIDLLLVDVVMPMMDGRELARRVLEIRPKVKILLMSGFEVTGLQDTGWPFIAKPFNISELTDASRQRPNHHRYLRLRRDRHLRLRRDPFPGLYHRQSSVGRSG